MDAKLEIIKEFIEMRNKGPTKKDIVRYCINSEITEEQVTKSLELLQANGDIYKLDNHYKFV